MNKQTILNVASQFINPEKLQTVSKAFDVATQITAIARNPRDALEKAGISHEDLKKAESFLDNPLASTILGAVGANKQEMLNTIRQAEGVFNANTPVEQAPASGELEALQRTLALLKK